ncbi:HAD-IIIA family hydrolase [Chlorobaculum sp. 24CR]|uniref:KdsC family phosphatase n=1 Tax=Chlorobaculum sp. 24CR TaxID=2508878 RepID=UPI00100A55A2|nr:HAD-IIIA family hydrolase [Chlorobaculum sp. 24CR]RXK88441.1 HAD-IIIA family hydrolase [Chlorobaculum sp. 24CR]
MILLSPQEQKARASRIRVVLSDNDGVFTDNGVYYSERGEEFKRYSIRDGMGVERLRAYGIETGIITGEVSPSLVRRAQKLHIERLYLGVKDKLSKLNEVLSDTGLDVSEIAYIGDDVNDIEIMNAIAPSGLVACPGDGMHLVEPCVHYRCAAHGGRGAFREYAEWLIAQRAL